VKNLKFKKREVVIRGDRLKDSHDTLLLKDLKIS
jgi:hypothetical protein